MVPEIAFEECVHIMCHAAVPGVEQDDPARQLFGNLQRQFVAVKSDRRRIPYDGNAVWGNSDCLKALKLIIAQDLNPTNTPAKCAGNSPEEP
jgi:hypothetical protein